MIERISNKLENINTKKMFKILGIMLIFYITFKVYEQSVSANILDAIGNPDNFKGLAGDGKYLGNPYKNNYYLDVKKLGMTDLFDKSTNFFANLIWSGVVIITYVLLIVFNLAFSMDIANMFDGILNTILTSLRTTIFDEYLLLAAAIGLIYVAISFLRNNTGQMLSRLSYIVFAIFLMTVITLYASNIVSIVTTISKGIGASSIVAISSNQTTENTIGQVSGELWGNLVHRPWVELEFDGKHTTINELPTVVDSILSLDSDSDKRQDLIDKINKENPQVFKENDGAGRILPSFLILIVNGFKMAIMIAIAFIQIIFQLMTILFVLTLPVMILLSISPSFGGSQVLVGVGKQILGAQVGIVLTSFLLGLMIKLDSLVATYLGDLGSYGWLAITIVQTGIYIGVVMQRKQIFLALMSIQRKISVASAGVWRGAMKTSDKVVDKTKETVANGARSARDVGSEAKDKLANGFGDMATRAGDGIRNMHSKSSDFAGSVADRLRNAQENRANEARDKSNETTTAKPEKQSTEKPRPNINTAAAGAREINKGENNINEKPNNKQENPVKPIREPNNKVPANDNLEIDTAGNEPKVLREPNELKNNNKGEIVEVEKPKINGNSNKSSNDKRNEKDRANPSSEAETIKPSPKVVRDNKESSDNTIKMTDELRNKSSNNRENSNTKKASKVRNIENTEHKNNNNNTEVNNKGEQNNEVKKDLTSKNNRSDKEKEPITNNDRAKMFQRTIR